MFFLRHLISAPFCFLWNVGLSWEHLVLSAANGSSFSVSLRAAAGYLIYFFFFGGGVVPKMAQGIIQPNTESGACSYMMTGWHDGMMGT